VHGPGIKADPSCAEGSGRWERFPYLAGGPCPGFGAALPARRRSRLSWLQRDGHIHPLLVKRLFSVRRAEARLPFPGKRRLCGRRHSQIERTIACAATNISTSAMTTTRCRAGTPVAITVVFAARAEGRRRARPRARSHSGGGQRQREGEGEQPGAGAPDSPPARAARQERDADAGEATGTLGQCARNRGPAAAECLRARHVGAVARCAEPKQTSFEDQGTSSPPPWRAPRRSPSPPDGRQSVSGHALESSQAPGEVAGAGGLRSRSVQQSCEHQRGDELVRTGSDFSGGPGRNPYAGPNSVPSASERGGSEGRQHAGKGVGPDHCPRPTIRNCPSIPG